MTERRAPVQASGVIRIHPAERRERIAAGEKGLVPGTVSWDEHERAWQSYSKRHGNQQSAERIAERAGFCYAELTEFLGHEPTTWEPIERGPNAD